MDYPCYVCHPSIHDNNQVKRLEFFRLSMSKKQTCFSSCLTLASASSYIPSAILSWEH